MKMKRLLKKCMSLLLGSAMVVGMFPASFANAAEVKASPFLTDADGMPRAAVQKVASDNHEIIDIRMPDDETHKVTIYLLDEDNSGRWSMVDVIDPDTQKLLDSQNVYDFSEGVYLSWNISGHLQIRLTNVWTKRYMDSKDTAIHGIFIDGEDAVEDGRAVVTTDESGEDTAANSFEGINILGRYAAAGQEFTMPFDKEVQSVELRFNGNIDPSSENLDKIRVLKDGNPVKGEMRSSFNSATFVPSPTLKDGSYTVEIPADVKNSAGQELGKKATASFEVETKVEVIYFREGMNYMTRRVDLAFNDRLEEAPDAALVYKGEGEDRQLRLIKKGNHGGLMFEVQDMILPSGTYHFTLPSGTKSISGAVCDEDYKKEFLFDSMQLSAKIDAPTGVEKDQPALLEVEECFGYGEMRYAFSEQDLAKAAYVPVKEEVEVPTTGLTGEQALYVQFRVKEGEKQGQESPVLHKAMYLGLAKKGELLPFDMEAAGAYDKDGFGSQANPRDGVFDLATDIWTEGLGGTSNYIADGTNGVEGLYDPDKDAAITTKRGIPLIGQLL